MHRRNFVTLSVFVQSENSQNFISITFLIEKITTKFVKYLTKKHQKDDTKIEGLDEKILIFNKI
jgi:hypothetical protein